MIPPNVKYCILTPTRDEEKFLAATIECVVRQSVQPAEWIIINDGSKDSTGKIIDESATKYPWIRALHRPDRGYRTTGGGVEAFLDGLKLLDCKNWEFLVNLDGDVTFQTNYFEKCFERFRQNQRLGIAGGTIYNKIGDELVLEKCAAFHVRGATKIYRRACWEDVGGLVRGLGWDTVDEVTANMKGWTTETFPDLHLTHYRVTGSGWGKWQGSVKDGKADYLVGYHPLFFAGKLARRIFKRPYVMQAVGLGYGFLRCYVDGTPRVVNENVKQFVRQQQVKRLLGQESIWK
jgi:poly-beta-1,6-N-acetyl-D-glucosamine synthase